MYKLFENTVFIRLSSSSANFPSRVETLRSPLYPFFLLTQVKMHTLFFSSPIVKIQTTSKNWQRIPFPLFSLAKIKTEMFSKQTPEQN